ncbi:hypothetical protein KEJ28_05635 [Candidatus Bathyarchaeota archaeon]|nr:hypothetical protein [Candidatus Bathyarchaeota archaeon]
MLKHLRVVPLAAESLGVRSMCTFVETPNLKILLDAGVSLCPDRFGLPPHPLEYRAIIEARRRISEIAGKADVVTVSHYHFDHYTPSYEDWLCNWTEEIETARAIYADKFVLIKNPRDRINFSQRRRAWVFQKTGGSFAKKLEIADGKTFQFGDTKLTFSMPVFHGPEDSALGWVLMTTIEFEDERLLFAPDVQGPISKETLNIILESKPNLLILGGPPLYLAGFRVDEGEINTGLRNLEKIVTNLSHVILEHHILRDADWQVKAENILAIAKRMNHRISTAAEFLRLENMLLEANRKHLYEEYPPPKDFERWMRKSDREKRKTPPPV